jgi:SAM-dependent methyltransferase
MAGRMKRLQRHKSEWEDLARMDPYWAILTNKNCQFGKWNLAEFLGTADFEIGRIMELAGSLSCPAQREVVLDFGCGVGRGTRVLARHFQTAVGVDISEAMIAQAMAISHDVPNCQFVLNVEPHLRRFPDASFDMIYSNYVLQHLASKPLIKSYIAEFIRVLKPHGLLVFQLPNYIPLKNRFQPRRRLYALLRTLGVNEHFLYEKLKLHPIAITAIAEEEVAALVLELNAHLLKIQVDPSYGSPVPSRTYLITRE